MKLRNIALCLLAAAAAATSLGTQAKKMSDLRIYINPGHGGYDSDDRNIIIYPFASRDSMGYWESKSNLYKGLHMYHILDSLGAKPFLSRIKNTTADDRGLYDISAECNSLNCDLFFSIHSNAGESVNYPIMLYREQVAGTPRYPENVTLSKIVFKNLISNRLPMWSRETEYVAGDITFYRPMGWGDAGLGVLRNLYTVGLLSEGSMHEHRPEAYRLMNDDYLWLEAWHFVRSIMEFAETETFSTGNVAGVVYDDNNLREHDSPSTKFSMMRRDKLMPVRNCRVVLQDMQGNTVQVRTTDNLYNGVFVFRNVAPGNYRLFVDDPRYYAYTKDVTVTANEVTYNDIPLTDKCEYPLEILTWKPKPAEGELVSCSSPIEFTFNTAINTEAWEKAFSITPAVAGYWTYTNSFRKATFTPELSLTKSTDYTVTVSTEACTANSRYENNMLQQPFTLTFTTMPRERCLVTGHSPADGGTVHFARPSIEIRFDNRINRNLAFSAFTLTDSKGNKVSMSSRNLSANTVTNNMGNACFSIPADLTLDEEYTATLTTDARDSEDLPLAEPLTFKFKAVDVTTEPEPEMVLKLDFESGCDFAYDKDQSAGIGTTTPRATRSTAKKIVGLGSGMFSYNFANTHDGTVTWNYTGETEGFRFNPEDKIGMYVYGDFNNHELQIGFRSGASVKYYKLCDLNFVGWQYKEITLSDLQAEYAPFTFAGFRLAQVKDPATMKGSFYIDNLAVRNFDDAGVNDVVADNNAPVVTAFNGILTVSGAQDTDIVRVYAADGRVVRAFRGNNAKRLAPGIYVVTVGDYSYKISVN